MQKRVPTFLYFISFVLAIAVSIKNLREPDIWWQIRTGEWILANKQVPVTDVFSFTHNGQPWINIKWGFEVMAAWIAAHAGPESVLILQMLVSGLIIFFILKTFRLLKLDSPALFFLCTVLLLFACEDRMIGRPEMFSHMFTVIFLYSLLHFHHTKSKRVWLLIPLQAVWCNLHEAYAIGIVMLLIDTAISWLLYFKNKDEKPWYITVCTFAATGALLINPRGILLLLRPLNIFAQVQTNKYTTELDSFLTPEYWQKESWFFVLTVLTIIVYLLHQYRNNQLKKLPDIFPLQYFGICLAFLFLAFTAYRNIIFFQLAAIPLLAFILRQIFVNIERYRIAFASGGIAIYLLVVSDKYYHMTASRDHFGLEVLSTNNPSGAARYIEENNLRTAKCFSDYLTSSYLLWRLQPDFKTYIDLRDLDIFSTAFFEQYLQIINDPAVFKEVDQKENFDYVVLFRRSNGPLHHYLYNDSVYGCVFADPVAAVYQKTDVLPQGDFFQTCKPIPSTAFASAVTKVFNPFYQPYDYDAVNYDYEAASFYTNAGKISLAEKRINQFLTVHPQSESAIELKSQIMTLKSQLKK
ncbi:MAG: hypothetical protein IT257_05385 [Chitinophagaceae bacterium]|nr:hypothetical protein [Chitinophagaceae bacterium]